MTLDHFQGHERVLKSKHINTVFNNFVSFFFFVVVILNVFYFVHFHCNFDSIKNL